MHATLRAVAAVACVLGPALCGACELGGSRVRVRPVVYHPADARFARQEAVFEAADGTLLGYVGHSAPKGTALVCLPGLEGHAGWLAALADMLCAEGYDVYGLDLRGAGINQRRGTPAVTPDVLMSDVHDFVASIRARYRRVLLVGLSYGGKIALTHALVHPDSCDGLVLVSPRIRVRDDVGPGLEPSSLVGDAELSARIRSDVLCAKPAADAVVALDRHLDQIIAARMATNRLPVQIYLAGRDRILAADEILMLLRAGRQATDIVRYPDMPHAIELAAPERLASDMLRWLAQERS